MRVPKYCALRVAVGGPTSRRSSVWRIWTHNGLSERAANSNVYVAVRSLAGVFKVSLHESGSWQCGFISDKAAHPWGRQNRHWEIWQRPSEFHPGLTMAIQILIPETELRAYSDSETQMANIKWLAQPKLGDCTELSILFQRGRPAGGTWPGKDSMATEALMRVRLLNRETLWVLNRTMNSPNGIEEDKQRIGQLTSNPPPDRIDDLAKPSARIVLFGSIEDGTRRLVEVAAPLASDT